MTTTILRQVSDAFVSELEPAKNHGDEARLRIGDIVNAERQAFLFFGGGPRPGAYVIEATVYLYVRNAWTGSHTMTLRPTTETWKERTVTWTRRPATTATNAANLAVGAKSPGAELAFDVTAMMRAAFLGTGETFTGFRLHDSSTSTVYDLHSSQASDPDLRPRLEITYTREPVAPYDLTPGDGEVVSIAKPVLRWSYYDEDEAEQGSFQVQISTSSSFTSPVYDSGTVTSPDSELDLSTTAFAGITNGTTRYWRVKVTNTDGQSSDYSDAVAISRDTKGSFVIEAPTSVTVDSTPEIITTLTGQNQVALEYAIYEIRGDNAPKFIYHKSRFKATTIDGDSYTFELPGGIVREQDVTYGLIARSWDDVAGRVSTAGDPAYAEDTIEFELVDPASAPNSPSTITVTQLGPGARLTWTRSAVPDYWQLKVDGELVIDKVPATEWRVSGTNYAMTYYGLEPGVEHELEIRALETE